MFASPQSSIDRLASPHLEPCQKWFSNWYYHSTNIHRHPVLVRGLQLSQFQDLVDGEGLHPNPFINWPSTAPSKRPALLDRE